MEKKMIAWKKVSIEIWLRLQTEVLI